MDGKFFTEDHEWVDIKGDECTVGVTTFAQEQLGDVVFVELPEIGREAERGDDVAVVESVKAASEVLAPLNGEVIAVNDALEETPGLVNEDPEGTGWFFRLRLSDVGDTEGLMDAAAYAKVVEAAS